MGTRGYDRWDIEEAIRESQERRHDARASDDSWILVEDDLTDVFGGGVWRYTPPRHDPRWRMTTR